MLCIHTNVIVSTEAISYVDGLLQQAVKSTMLELKIDFPLCLYFVQDDCFVFQVNQKDAVGIQHDIDSL